MQRHASSRAGVALPVALVLLLAGCDAGGGKTANASPEAAFDSIKAAAGTEDWRGVCGNMTQDSVDAFAGGLVAMGSMLDMIAALGAMGGENEETKKLAESSKRVKEILAKHGITAEVTGQINASMMSGQKPDPEALKKFAEPIADCGAFVGEMFEALKSMGGAGSTRDMRPEQLREDAKLVDLKIDGEQATANVESGGKKSPIEFQKVDGSWLVSVRLDAMRGGR